MKLLNADTDSPSPNRCAFSLIEINLPFHTDNKIKEYYKTELATFIYIYLIIDINSNNNLFWLYLIPGLQTVTVFFLPMWQNFVSNCTCGQRVVQPRLYESMCSTHKRCHFWCLCESSNGSSFEPCRILSVVPSLYSQRGCMQQKMTRKRWMFFTLK